MNQKPRRRESQDKETRKEYETHTQRTDEEDKQEWSIIINLSRKQM